MAYNIHKTQFRQLSPERLEAWSKVNTASASDMMNRGQAMGHDIKPLDRSMRICGQARTVRAIHADNSIIHYANSYARPGEVVVAEAGGNCEVAMFGGVTALEGIKRKLGGLVIDGAVRDIREAIDLGYPIFCKGVTPKGPHKAFGGEMDIPIACGGLAVKPGDLVLGDMDGITVVPLEWEEEVFAKVQEFRKTEDYWLTIFDGPKSLYEVLNIPEPTFIE